MSVDLLKELRAAYVLLMEAHGLALERLQSGGVSGLDQMAFWTARQRVEEFVDLPLETEDEQPELLRRIDELAEQILAIDPGYLL